MLGRLTVNRKGFDAFDKDLNPVEGSYVQIHRRNDDEGVKTNLPNLPINMTDALTKIVRPLIDLGASLDIDVYDIENFDIVFSAGPMFKAIRYVVDDEISSIRTENHIKMSREGKFNESRRLRGRMLREGFRTEQKEKSKYVLKFLEALYDVFDDSSDREMVRIIADGYRGDHGSCINWLHRGPSSCYRSFEISEDKYPVYIELNGYGTVGKLVDYLEKHVPDVGRRVRGNYQLSRKDIEEHFDELMEALS